MRLNKLILSVLLLAAFVAAPRALAAERTSVQALLIIASHEKTPADPRLAPYEATLQRNVPESSFRLVSESSATVSGTGRATISFGREHKVELEGEAGAGIRLKVKWSDGRRVVINSSFVLERGVPLMLGHRPSGDGEVPIVLLIAK